MSAFVLRDNKTVSDQWSKEGLQHDTALLQWLGTFGLVGSVCLCESVQFKLKRIKIPMASFFLCRGTARENTLFKLKTHHWPLQWEVKSMSRVLNVYVWHCDKMPHLSVSRSRRGISSLTVPYRKVTAWLREVSECPAKISLSEILTHRIYFTSLCSRGLWYSKYQMYRF